MMTKKKEYNYICYKGKRNYQKKKREGNDQKTRKTLFRMLNLKHDGQWVLNLFDIYHMFVQDATMH